MLVEWIAVVILAFLGLILLQVEHHGKKIKIFIVLIIAAVIYFSIVGHFSTQEIDLKSPRGIAKSVYLYFGWIGETTSSLYDIGKNTTIMVGDAIKIDKTIEDRLDR